MGREDGRKNKYTDFLFFNLDLSVNILVEAENNQNCYMVVRDRRDEETEVHEFC